MKRFFAFLLIVSFVLSLSAISSDAATVKKTVKKTTVVKKATPATPAPQAAPQALAAPSRAEAPKVNPVFLVKGGLAGGAGLVAAEYWMPMGPVFLAGEAGYAMGNNFGLIDAAAKVIYSMGAPFVGLEVGYAGYSKDVTNVPGLSGTIKAGVGVGLIGGTTMGPIQLGVGYNTALGARADAGYRLMF